MAAVTICSDFGAQENKVSHCFHCFSIYLPWSDGTSAFSWQNSISLCPASFCIPRPNLPVTPGVSWLPTFAFQSPIMKRTSFLGVSSHEIKIHLLLGRKAITNLSSVQSLSCVRLFVTPWTVAYHTPQSIGFSRQEYWSGLPFPSPYSHI